MILAELMAGLGNRVRQFRADQKLSRRALATEAGVSERHLAQLESGQGNVSLKFLLSLADAFGIDLERLLGDSIRSSSGLDARLEGIKGRKTVVLIGLRGAGKTTLGKAVSADYGVPFVRLVEEIEKLAGMAISEIFSLSGNESYRRYEVKVLEQNIDTVKPVLIEAGGSIVLDSATYQTMLRNCVVVWVKTSAQEHLQRVIDQGDLRPMQGFDDAMTDLKNILSEREPEYARAHYTLDTSGRTVESSIRELETILKKHL